MTEEESRALLRTTAELRDMLALFRQTHEAILQGNAIAFSEEFKNTTKQMHEWASGQEKEHKIALSNIAGPFKSHVQTAVTGAIEQSLAVSRAGMSTFAGLEGLGLEIAKKVMGPTAAVLVSGGIIGAKLLESYRMLGAQYARVVTAGHGERNEPYAKTGTELVQSVNAIRMQTGASADAVFGTIEALSRLGMEFNDDTKKAVAYTQAVDQVLNLTKGTTEKFMQLGLSKYGQDWESVATAVQKLTASTDEFGRIAEQTKDAQAIGLSSPALQMSIMSDVLSATVKTNINLTTLAEVVKEGTGILYKTGTRTGMMAQVLGQAISSLAPGGNAGYMDAINQSVVLKFLFETHGDSESRAFYKDLQDTMSKQGMDRDLVAVALSQKLAQDKTGQYANTYLALRFRGRSRIGTEHGASPGDARMRQFQFGMQFEGLGMRAAMEQQQLSELFQRETSKGTSGAAFFAGRDTNQILASLGTQAPAMLSAQEKLQMFAEGLLQWRDTYWDTYRAVEPAIVDTQLRFINGLGPNAAMASMMAKNEKLELKNALVRRGLHQRVLSRVPPSLPTGRGRRLLVSSTIVRTANGVEQHQVFYKNDRYAELREKHAALSGIPELEPLMREMERQESNFNPSAVSYPKPGRADIGLGQISPAILAKYRNEAAARLGIRPDQVSLYNPEHNIAIQSMLVRDLNQQYHGDTHKILRTYNTGRPESSAAGDAYVRAVEGVS